MLDIPKNQKSLISLFFEDPRSRGPGIGTGCWMLDAGYWMMDAGILVPCSWFLVPDSSSLAPFNTETLKH